MGPIVRSSHTRRTLGTGAHECLVDFVAVVEPIVELLTGRTVAHELLLRPRSGETLVGWHRDRGDTGWRGFTYQVLQLAAGALVSRDLPLHVNVTALDLATPSFATLVAEIVPASAMERLVLELTEQFPVLDEPATAANVVALRRAGVRLAIDDYGEGWSGLATLLLVEPDVVKVTVSMLESEAGRGSAAEILALAHDLGATTVLEQIERPDQLDWAIEAGFALGQGRLWLGATDALPLLRDFGAEETPLTR